MGKVVLDITMSLDGYVAAPNDGVGAGLGVGGERLHNWVFGGPWSYDEQTGSPTGVDAEVIEEMFGSVGAVIVGRRMYDVTEGWGGSNPFPVPCFLLTHRPTSEYGTEGFTLVTDGIHSALAQAQAVAVEKQVGIFGGANVAQQYLAAGLVDQMQIHLAPVLLGGGTRLFGDTAAPVSLERTRTVESPYATHLRFDVLK